MEFSMPSSQPFARNDTLLGVCQSLGDDFGFNPIYLRILFGASLIWNPLAVIAAYLALGIVIAASNWIFPNPRMAVADEAGQAEVRMPAPVAAAPTASSVETREPELLAA